MLNLPVSRSLGLFATHASHTAARRGHRPYGTVACTREREVAGNGQLRRGRQQVSDLGAADVAEVGKHDLPRLDDRAEDRAAFAVFAACGGIPELPGGGQAQGPL